LEWAKENVMKINPGKCKAVSFAIFWVKDSLIYFGEKGVWGRRPKNSGIEQL
jgi:hypothetical protein